MHYNSLKGSYMKRETAKLALLLFAAGSLPAATYYVNPGGNDESSGLTDRQVWRTIARVNTQAFESGDELLFERDGIWRETLMLRATG
jgi:hypothetical protein